MTKETIEEMMTAGMAKGMQAIIDLLNEQRAADKKEAAKQWATDVSLSRHRMQQLHKEAHQLQHERDKQEILELQANALLQESPQRPQHASAD